MKKTVKKVVAKTPVRKTVAKKPMMKKGGSMKKPLRKAQYGDGMIGTPSLKDVGVKNVYQGPLNKSDYENLNKLYPVNTETPRLESTVMAPRVLQKDKTVKGPKVRMSQSAGNQYMQNRVANYLRSGRTLDSDPEFGAYAPKEQDLYSVEGKKRGGAKKTVMKKGGAMKKSLPKAGPGKIIKAIGTGIKKAGKVVKNELTPDRGGYNPFRKKPAFTAKTAAKVTGLGALYTAGAKYALDKTADNANKKKVQENSDKVKANRLKYKQLGKQSFAKGGVAKKTMVKSKKK